MFKLYIFLMKQMLVQFSFKILIKFLANLGLKKCKDLASGQKKYVLHTCENVDNYRWLLNDYSNEPLLFV